MKRIVSAAFAGTATVAIAVTPATAAPTTYEFSGRLSSVSLFSGSTNPDWAFARGAMFSGTLIYDPAAVSYSYDYINRPDWTLTFHFSPLVSLSYRIETANGAFTYAPPAAGSYAAIGAENGSGDGWTGVDLRFQNYSFSGAPQYSVPATGYVGGYYAHSSFLSLNHDTSQPLTSTDANVDLAALFTALPPIGRTFSVRFSDPARWNERPGVERIDAVVSGQIDRLSAVSSGVPEPATWISMILGFGAIGGTMRRRRCTENTSRLA